MRRKRTGKSPVSVSLFPFLAVLICTMGAMIVLLVLVVQQARVHADTITQQREQSAESKQASKDQLRQEEEDYLWQQEILQQQRAELTKQLADKRLSLSHVEDHIRRLEQRLAELQAEADAMRRSSDADVVDQSAAEIERTQLQLEIEAAQERLKQAREELAKRERFYAIIPYRGPNGTQRRPIYVECTESGILIHPEAIVLHPRDFSGPLGPGNPLDAALRAIREHWARVEGEANSSEPYPLLIVRPDGAVAYTMARAAMAAWDDEFGYELVEDDVELSFPPSDPTLKRLLEAAVDTARQRQVILAAAMPSRFEGPTMERFAVPEQSNGAGGGLAAAGGTAGYGGGTTAGGTNGYGRGTAAGGSPGASAPRPGRTSSSESEREAGGEHDSQHGGPENPKGQTGSGDGQSDAAAAAGQSGQACGMAPGAAIQSMAATKGANWATPKKTPAATGITRPIGVECYIDRLIITPGANDTAEPKVVSIEGPMRASMDSFVSGIWDIMDRWGMAVMGGYWKPTLRVRVHPGADGRFYELQALLKDSGLDVVRR